jgi:competence protein ComEA
MRALLTLISIVLALSISACARRHYSAPPKPSQPQDASHLQPRININTASARELEGLPGIGKALASRIVEHREKYGPFRRAEHLIIVRGMSDKRFRAMQDLVTVE